MTQSAASITAHSTLTPPTTMQQHSELATQVYEVISEQKRKEKEQQRLGQELEKFKKDMEYRHHDLV